MEADQQASARRRSRHCYDKSTAESEDVEEFSTTSTMGVAGSSVISNRRALSRVGDDARGGSRGGRANCDGYWPAMSAWGLTTLPADGMRSPAVARAAA